MLLCHILVLGSVLSTAAQYNNYCYQICGNKTSHTLCRFPRPGPGRQCAGYLRAPLTADEKTRILARLNQRRNQAALGLLLELPTASNMMKLRWVDDLAISAQRWADQCAPPATPDRRDECRDLYMATAGQAVASIVGDAPGLRVEALVDSWHMQSLLFRGNVTSYQPAPTDKSFYGDFTQILWAKSYMVGCGRSHFMAMQGARYVGVVRLVCNLAPRGNLRARPVWMPGPPCARCPADTACYADSPALCHYRDANNNSDKHLKADDASKSVDDVLPNIIFEDSYSTVKMKEHMFKEKVENVSEKNQRSIVLKYTDKEIKSKIYLDTKTKNNTKKLIESNDDRFLAESKISSKNYSFDQTFESITDKKITVKNKTLIGRPKAYELEDLIYKQSLILDPNSYFSYRRAVNFDDENVDLDGSSAHDPNMSQDDILDISTEAEKTDDDNSQGDEDNEMSVEERQTLLKNLLNVLESRKKEYDFTENKSWSDLDPIYSTTTERFSETKEDLVLAVERAQYEQAMQPARIKVRRELRERALEERASTPRAPTTVSLPPLLGKLVHYFPFLSYEARSGAGSAGGGRLEIAGAVIVCWLK